MPRLIAIRRRSIVGVGCIVVAHSIRLFFVEFVEEFFGLSAGEAGVAVVEGLDEASVDAEDGLRFGPMSADGDVHDKVAGAGGVWRLDDAEGAVERERVAEIVESVPEFGDFRLETSDFGLPACSDDSGAFGEECE